MQRVAITVVITFLLAGCAKKPVAVNLPPANAVDVPPECVSNLRCEGTWRWSDADGHLFCDGKFRANLACRGIPK